MCHIYEYVTDGNMFIQLYASATVTYVYECHMSNLHMCKQYEIFTSYKIATRESI